MGLIGVHGQQGEPRVVRVGDGAAQRMLVHIIYFEVLEEPTFPSGSHFHDASLSKQRRATPTRATLRQASAVAVSEFRPSGVRLLLLPCRLVFVSVDGLVVDAQISQMRARRLA